MSKPTGPPEESRGENFWSPYWKPFSQWGYERSSLLYPSADFYDTCITTWETSTALLRRADIGKAIQDSVETQAKRRHSHINLTYLGK